MFLITTMSYAVEGCEEVIDLVETEEDLANYINAMAKKGYKVLEEFENSSYIPSGYSVPFIDVMNMYTYRVRKMKFVKEPSL